MGFSTNVTPEDIPSIKPIPASWYPARIISYTEETAKGKDGAAPDGTINAVLEFQLLDGEEGIKGRKIRRYFNEKPKGMAFGNALWTIAFPNNWVPGKGGKITSEMLKSLEGREFQVYARQDPKSGYPTIDDYRPIDFGK